MQLSSPAYAWGLTGHRIVGALAERHLTMPAKKEVLRVLDGYKLQDVSNWADEIKSDRDVLHQSFAKWHYIEVHELSELDDQAPDDWPVNLNQALQFIVNRLRHRQFDGGLTEPVLLRLLVHLVADAHQPLHVGNGVDHGGNSCYVRWFHSKWTMRLHSIWDSKLIDAYQLNYSEYVDYLDHMSADTVADWQSHSIKQWLIESRQLHSEIYPRPKGVKIEDYCVRKKSMLQYDKAPKLGFEYQSRVRPILNQRLAQAGVRLAGVLNEIYRDSAIGDKNGSRFPQ